MGRERKQRDRKDKEEKKMIRCLCVMLYLFCILNLMGVSLNFRTEEKMHYSDTEKVKEVISEKVSQNHV